MPSDNPDLRRQGKCLEENKYASGDMQIQLMELFHLSLRGPYNLINSYYIIFKSSQGREFQSLGRKQHAYVFSEPFKIKALHHFSANRVRQLITTPLDQ